MLFKYRKLLKICIVYSVLGIFSKSMAGNELRDGILDMQRRIAQGRYSIVDFVNYRIRDLMHYVKTNF